MNDSLDETDVVLGMLSMLHGFRNTRECLDPLHELRDTLEYLDPVLTC